jgi:uroporphyrinogen decarboxylase
MNARERFLATMRFEPCDHPPYWEWAYWVEAIQRWYSEALPQKAGLPLELQPTDSINGDAGAWRPGGYRDRDVHDTLQLDEGIVHLPVRGSLRMRTSPVVLEEDDQTRVVVDEDGIRKRVFKHHMSMPQFLSFPIESRRDWEEMRATLDLSFLARVPANWTEIVASLRLRTCPVALGGYPEGLFGELRQLMGPERLLVTFYDDPALIHEILSTLTELWLNFWEEAMVQVDVDCVHFWEDMCFRSGPLISPAMFREFLSPYYRRLTAFLRGRGIDIVLVDTDGDCRSLIPLFIEAGITGLYPFEVQAGMNVEEVGRQYPTLQILGGIDKRALAQDHAAIDRELERRLPFLLQRGGYVPTVDHHVPPDVSWSNFAYYRQRVADLCERARSRL